MQNWTQVQTNQKAYLLFSLSKISGNVNTYVTDIFA
jgi:hypothetical protein